MATLSEIRRYPVKSCRGDDLREALVEPWGLAGDRRWMLVDDDGLAITARVRHAMLLVHPRVTPDGLRVSAPDLPDLDVAFPDAAAQRPVRIWDDDLTAAACGPDVDAWFTTALGVPAHLVHLDDPNRRPTSPAYSRPGDVVSFADNFPLLLTTEASLGALNQEITARGAASGPVPMVRFRPSVVVAGTEAWQEDDWRRVRIGEAVFRVVKGAARCVLPTIDADTIARGKEPIATLARIRKWDGQTWFGVKLVPDTPGVRIRLGDDVEVLDAVPPGAGPIRASTVG